MKMNRTRYAALAFRTVIEIRRRHHPFTVIFLRRPHIEHKPTFTTQSGQHSTTHYQTVMLFESQELRFADFELRPEHLFHKIGGAFGYQDIDFDDSPEFSKQYLLRGPDEGAVRDLFDRPARNYLENQKKVSAEGAGGRLVFYRMGKRVKPEELRDFIKDGVQLLTLMAG